MDTLKYRYHMDAIGTRPVGLHLDALTKMGAEISIDNGYITAHCKILKDAV